MNMSFLHDWMKMKQVIIFCAGFLGLIHSCWPEAVCYVSDTQKSYVTSLAISMAQSVGPCVVPDPSVLLALNLGNMTDISTQDLLVKQLKEDAAQKINGNKPFSSGKVALYVMALQSSCSDPTELPNSNIDLVHLLETKTKEELDSVASNGSPLTTWYQVSLDVLGLCVMSKSSAIEAAHISAKMIPTSPSGHTFSVDTAAVAVMGFTCVLEMEDVPIDTFTAVKYTVGALVDMILDAQKDGLLGNIYSTGLAGQALTAAKSYYSSERWDCPQTLKAVTDLIPQKKFSLPIAAAQLLPFLWGKSYVSVKDIPCPSHEAQQISVEYTIVNDLIGENFKYSIVVSVKEGSTLLEVMEKAKQLDPKHFSFQTETSSWGSFVTSINNLGGSTNDKTYWQFFSDVTPLSEGVGTYKPSNKEHILAIFSKY
ncbi:cobalamin binding intrinsic factor-like [Hyla sarda]|uniref:cobalamin binding intrinsic factor-like n=1 Tax=Hyla sarda TaxID=327740 RepID=UPI0024C2887F|nr:cobalamin binding intrinsic factor-like [Hyla sarda]